MTFSKFAADKGRFVFVLAASAAFIIPASAGAGTTVTVLGTSNPFLADQPAGTTCCSGDSAPATALGTYGCLRAVREFLTGSSSVADARIGVVGLGSVGSRLARMLADDGAELVVADVDASRRTLADRIGADWSRPDVVPTLELDIIVPAATGALIGPDLIDRLRCGAVVGPANNQLTDDGVADGLHRRGVLWAPDYIVGAGGIVNAVARELDAVPAAEAEARVRGIATTLRSVLDEAAHQGRAPHRVATQRARLRLDSADAGSANAY